MKMVFVASYFLVAHHEEIQRRQDTIQEELKLLLREWEEKWARLEEENERLKWGGGKAFENLKVESEPAKRTRGNNKGLKKLNHPQVNQLQNLRAKMH